MTMTKQTLAQTIDEDTYVYLLDLQREWKRTLPKLRDHDALKLFPEAKVCIREKIREWEGVRDKFSESIKTRLQELREYDDEFSKWFWKEWLKHTDGSQLMGAERHIKRLKWLLYSKNKQTSDKGRITQSDIEYAGSVPLEELVDVQLRTGGKTLFCLCPFHEERSPSFHIYPEQNRWHCFGCGESGDSITFIQLRQGLGFIEAVKYLTGLSV